MSDDHALLIEEDDHGFRVTAPPRGFDAHAVGSIVIGMIILLLASGVALVVALDPKHDLEGAFTAAALCLVYGSPGLILVLSGVSHARTRVVIDAANQEVAIEKIGLFRTSRREWLAVDLEDIRVEVARKYSETLMTMELQFIPTNGPLVRLLQGWSHVELETVATRLRSFLKINGAADEGPEGPLWKF